MPEQLVALLHRTDACGRTGIDEVPGFQLEETGEIGDHLRHFPDQLVQIALLLHLAIHLQPDGALGRMTDLRSRYDLRARRRRFESLADFPGAAGLLRLALQIAARHIEPDRIAED